MLLPSINLYLILVKTAFLAWEALSTNLIVLAVVGLILVLAASVSVRIAILFRKKRQKHEVIRPVTDLIGDERERIEELNRDISPFGFSYEPYEDIFYSLMNPWQREVGYCRLYDEASAALSMIIDCEPIRFTYGGRRWLIEFWKGQYGMTTGGEVGIYATDRPDLSIPGVFNGTFYFCVNDDNRINMSFVLRKNGNLVFTRTGYHWWLTGFKLGEFSQPHELSMDITLDLYDREMANIFVDALKKAGYQPNEYGIQGRRVYIRYSKPHFPQPLTRTSFTDFIMQMNNESLCDAYNRLTAEYLDTPDKLEIVRKEAPEMYNQILNMGKPRAVYEAYNTIKSYLNKN